MRTMLVLGLVAIAAGCHREKVPTEKYFSGQPVAHWVEELKSGNSRARKKAVDVLGNVGPADPAAIPALTRALKDPDTAVRDAAVLALSKIGAPAAEARPALEELTRDPSPTIRGHAVTALDRIAGKS